MFLHRSQLINNGSMQVWVDEDFQIGYNYQVRELIIDEYVHM